MADLRKLSEKSHEVKLRTENVDTLISDIKTGVTEQPPFAFFRVLQGNYPNVWEAIKTAATAKHLEENTEFLDDFRNFYLHPSETSNLQVFYDKYIKNEVINIDSEEKKSFEDFLSKDPLKAKGVLSEIAKKVAKLLCESLITTSDFDKEFKKGWVQAQKEFKKQ